MLGAFRDALRIALLDAAEGFLPVRQRHLIAALMRETQGGFDRAISAADHEDVRIGVRLSLDQAVHHLGQLFSRNTQLARRAAPAEGEDHRPGAIAPFVRLDRVHTVRIFLNGLDLLARVDAEPRLFVNLFPETQDLFLRDLQFVEFAVHGKLDGTGQHQFLARVLGDGAAEFVLLERDVAELLFDGAQRGTDPCGTRTHDAHVRHAGDCAAAFDRKESARDRVHAVATLIDRVLDKREAAELSRDEHVGDGGLVVWIELGHVRADAGTRHDDGDRPDGTRLGAEAVADAFVTIHDCGFARDHREHVPLRADVDARATADALGCVDMGVLGARPIRAEFAALRCRKRGGLLAMHPANVSDDREKQDQAKRHIGQCRVQAAPPLRQRRLALLRRCSSGAPFGGGLRHGSCASEEITNIMAPSTPVPDRRAHPSVLPVAAPERPSLAALAPPPPARRSGRLAVTLLVFALVAICIGGARYYFEPMAARVRSPWHAWLKPSGYVGQSAGLLALALFLFLWLYPLRKKYRWLAFTGAISRWLNAHVLAALALPLLVAVHAAWRFRGVIGLGFWSMMVVWLSGIVGRYIYARIPRGRAGVELTREEIARRRAVMLVQIAQQSGLDLATIQETLAPTPAAQRLGVWGTLKRMVADDFARRAAERRLRRLWDARGPRRRTADRAVIRSVMRLARQEVALAQQMRPP